MRKRALATLAATPLLLLAGCEAKGQATFQEDVIPTAAGDLTITFIGHGTLMFSFDGKVIHVDPVGREADYSTMPDADLVLVTHEHGDHLDPDAIAAISTEETVVIYSRSCEGRVEGAIVMNNGEARTELGIGIEAIPAYNIVHMRSSGQPYHPKGNGNGYVITFGDTRVLVAGDTENTPEMMALENIDVAFLPMNLPYTMTPEMVAEAARAFRPGILYPYHFGRTDPAELVELLEGVERIEVRVREMS
jgi:L-ascorbate metabolism protein UlaG (beta-lactamase superfamily)